MQISRPSNNMKYALIRLKKTTLNIYIFFNKFSHFCLVKIGMLMIYLKKQMIVSFVYQYYH